MSTSTPENNDGEERPIVVDGDRFRIEGPPLDESVTDEAMRKAKYTHYDPARIPDGGRVGWVYERRPGSNIHSTRIDPDKVVKAAYNEHDGIMYEFVSCETLAYAKASEIQKSDLELFEEALEDLYIGGEETFRLRIEVEERTPDYLGDRMVRCDHITVKANSEDEAYRKLEDRGMSGLGDIEISVTRKFDHYDIETQTLQDPVTSTSYVWVHTEDGSEDFEILGRERGRF